MPLAFYLMQFILILSCILFYASHYLHLILSLYSQTGHMNLWPICTELWWIKTLDIGISGPCVQIFDEQHYYFCNWPGIHIPYVQIYDDQSSSHFLLPDIHSLNIWMFVRYVQIVLWMSRVPFFVPWYSHSGHWNFLPICTDFLWAIRLPL